MKSRVLIAIILLGALAPMEALGQTSLDQISEQIQTSNIAPGEPRLTIDDLRESQASETQQRTTTRRSSGPPPDVIGNTSDGIGTILSTDRLIDPITGRIDGAIDGVTGSVNDGINRALSGLLSPIDGAIDGALGRVDGAIDRVISSVMAPVDKVISDVMTSIDKQINDLLDGIFGETVDEVVGETVDGVLGETAGGILGGLLGGGGNRSVEALYNPTSPLTSIISASSFQSLLPGVTKPYTDAIPFALGSMGLPDYSKILPTLDALVAGEQGNPNQTIQGADRFSTTPQTLTKSLGNEVERIGSRSIANGTLSEAGQNDMKADLEGATQTLDTAIQIADESQELDVTQDVMKNLSAQLAQDSVLRAGQYKQDMIARQQQAANAVVTTQISQLLDEQNRARRAQATGNSARMHQAAGQLHLPGEKGDE